MAKYLCQHCGQSLETPDSMAGKEAVCPHCGKTTRLVLVEPAGSKRPKVTIPPITEVEPLKPAEVAPFAQQLVANMERVIVGKHEPIVLAVATLLAEGHLLVEDVPGVAKTMLGRALAQSAGCTFKRIQCTPDLQPQDVLGEARVDPQTGRTEFVFGPLFSQFVLVDEINRASPRTQAALLEAMGEGMITSERVTYHLQHPFMVIATQNPIEQEGTFPLPEAQKDRFLVRLSLGYPALQDEREMCERFQLGHPIETLKPVATPDQIMRCQQAVRAVRVDAEVCDYLLALVHATRKHPALRLGASPRASLGLFRLAQALAAIEGSATATMAHVRAIAPAVLTHRLIGREDKDTPARRPQDIVAEILAQTDAAATRPT